MSINSWLMARCIQTLSYQILKCQYLCLLIHLSLLFRIFNHQLFHVLYWSFERKCFHGFLTKLIYFTNFSSYKGSHISSCKSMHIHTMSKQHNVFFITVWQTAILLCLISFFSQMKGLRKDKILKNRYNNWS